MCNSLRLKLLTFLSNKQSNLSQQQHQHQQELPTYFSTNPPTKLPLSRHERKFERRQKKKERKFQRREEKKDRKRNSSSRCSRNKYDNNNLILNEVIVPRNEVVRLDQIEEQAPPYVEHEHNFNSLVNDMRSISIAK